MTVLADPGRALKISVRLDRCVRADLHQGADVSGIGIDDGHAVERVPAIDPGAKGFVGLGKLPPVVYTHEDLSVIHGHADDIPALTVNRAKRIRQVVLALRVGVAQGWKNGQKGLRVEAVDGGVYFLDR